MRKESLGLGMLGSALVMTVAAVSAHAESKMDQWKKYRASIATAVACEKGYIQSYLEYLNANSSSYIDPDKNSVYVDVKTDVKATKSYIRKNTLNDLSGLSRTQSGLQARQALLEAAVPELAPILDDQKCENEIFQSLQSYFNGQPHSSLDEVKRSLNSSIGNYLMGRWATYQARLGHGNRVKTTIAWGIRERLTEMRNTELKRPGDEFGEEAEVKQAAAADKLLGLWISWNADSSNGRDQVDNCISDISENIIVNGVFSNTKSTFEQIQDRIGNPLDKAIVGKVVASVIKSEPIIQKEGGKAKLIVEPTTYSVVFFKPLSFTATECASYVSAHTWSFSGNTLSLNQACESFVKKTASMTPYPVAVSPDFAKTLTVDVSNLNCMMNESPRIDISAPEETVLAEYTQTTKVWVQGKSKWAPTRKTQKVYSTGAHQTELATRTSAWTSAPDQYDQDSTSALQVCVPASVYVGSGPNKKLVNFLGIPINK